jgi:hypothetical protein
MEITVTAYNDRPSCTLCGDVGIIAEVAAPRFSFAICQYCAVKLTAKLNDLLTLRASSGMER